MTTDIASVIDRMGSLDASERLAAVEELMQSAEAAQPAVVRLLRACLDDDDRICEAAAAALEAIGAPRPEDLGEIAQWLNHSDPNAGYWAATLIGRLESVAAPAVQTLGSTLSENPQAIVRQRAAWALGKIGPDSEPAIGALQNAAAGPDARLARLAEKALAAIRGEE